jgi:magnesium chelatase subunit ChlD-like protein
VKTGETFTPRKLDTPLDKLTRKHAGRRSRTRTDRKRGRYIMARPANGKTSDIAFDATIRAAAPFQKRREEQRKHMAFAILPSDLQRKIRVKRMANLVLFLVDASWSMAVAERMNATKGAILSLLTDAYQRRDRVGLIVFQKDRATLVLPPTNSVQLAQRALMDIPVGGKTPLSAGLLMAHDVLQREKRLHPDVQPLLIGDDRRCRAMFRLAQWPRRKNPSALPKRLPTSIFARWWSIWNMPPSTRAWPSNWPTISKRPATISGFFRLYPK